MNAPQTYDAGFAHQIGRYSDAECVDLENDALEDVGDVDLPPARTTGRLGAIAGQLSSSP